MEIHNEMVNVLGDAAPSKTMVGKLALEFTRGRTSVENDPGSGRPTPDLYETNFIRGIGRPMLESAEIMGISHERVHRILTQELGMKKLSAGRVPH